jgi:hypothetical protein
MELEALDEVKIVMDDRAEKLHVLTHGGAVGTTISQYRGQLHVGIWRGDYSGGFAEGEDLPLEEMWVGLRWDEKRGKWVLKLAGVSQ